MEQISVTSNELGIVINNIIKKKFEEASNLGFIEENRLGDLFEKLCIVGAAEKIDTPPATPICPKTSTAVAHAIQIINYKEFPKKPSVNLPFCNVIVDRWCFGIKLNHGLYTQCTKKKEHNKSYCKTCIKQCKKNKNNLPNNGDIRQRQYNKIYTAPNKKREQPYSKIVKKQNIELKFALREAKKLGWTIPAAQLKDIKNIKISSIVSDSSDDECIDIIDYKIKEAAKEFPQK